MSAGRVVGCRAAKRARAWAAQHAGPRRPRTSECVSLLRAAASSSEPPPVSLSARRRFLSLSRDERFSCLSLERRLALLSLSRDERLPFFFDRLLLLRSLRSLLPLRCRLLCAQVLGAGLRAQQHKRLLSSRAAAHSRPLRLHTAGLRAATCCPASRPMPLPHLAPAAAVVVAAAVAAAAARAAAAAGAAAPGRLAAVAALVCLSLVLLVAAVVGLNLLAYLFALLRTRFACMQPGDGRQRASATAVSAGGRAACCTHVHTRSGNALPCACL